MHIIEVIPLTNLPQNVPQLLSYFFDSHLNKGAIVEVLIGNRKTEAAVVSSTPLEQQKSSLKKSQFQLKKLSKVISLEPKVSDIQFKIALWLSKTYYAPLGLSLKTVMPSKNWTCEVGEVLTSQVRELPKPVFIKSPPNKSRKIISQYIKDADGQILVIVPDKTVLNTLKTELEVKFSLAMTEDKLILGTRKDLFRQFKNLKLIIVEDPLNEMYKSDMTPKYNTPDLAEEIARLHRAKVVFISPVVGVKNYFKIQNKDYEFRDEDNPPAACLPARRGRAGNSQPDIKVINMINETRTDNPDMLSKDLKESMLKTLEKGRRVLILSSRKGFTGLLVCQNCGLTIKCPNCSAPLKVHKSTELILKCHRCPHVQQFPKFCPNCNSYKLKTAGPAGTQKIYERVREFLDRNNVKAPVLAMDLDIAKNETEEEEILDEVRKPKPSILVATQAIFSYRYALNFDLIGVINTDSLVSIPDYNIEERLLYQLKELVDFGPEKLILQTYNPDNEILKSFASNNYDKFYENELAIRQAFGYPPFSRLIKLTFRDKDQKRAFFAARTSVEKLRMAVVRLAMSDKIIVSDSTSGFMERERGLYNYHIILKSLTGDTPREILKYVPAGWSIDVDPRTIL